MQKEYVIGFDFGDQFAHLCFIEYIDNDTKKDGKVFDLTDPYVHKQNGIPSAFFYSKKRGILVGADAAKAVPKENCIRYLQRDLLKKGRYNSVIIDGREFTYQEMLLAVAQHVIRSAAKELERMLHIKTNKVAFSCPANMSTIDKKFLISILENITLEDGTNIEIIGTIAEPAAVTLDYLAVSKIHHDATVLVADLGSESFDVSILKAFPDGRQYSESITYYYNVLFFDTFDEISNKKFADCMKKVVLRKLVDVEITPRFVQSLDFQIEYIMEKLETADIYQPDIMLPNGNFIDDITRAEFEDESSQLLNKLLCIVERIINANIDINLDYIILTGVGAKMPMLEYSFKERFSKYAKKIDSHVCPNSIASAASRYFSK